MCMVLLKNMFTSTKVLRGKVCTVQYTNMYICNQREVVGLLEYQAMPSLRDVAHDGVWCTLINRSAPDRGKWFSPSGQTAWTVHHVQNHTLLLGHSPQATQTGHRVGPAL